MKEAWRGTGATCSPDSVEYVLNVGCVGGAGEVVVDRLLGVLIAGSAIVRRGRGERGKEVGHQGGAQRVQGRGNPVQKCACKMQERERKERGRGRGDRCCATEPPLGCASCAQGGDIMLGRKAHMG